MGILPDHNELVESNGFNGYLCNAVYAGGKQNGILTAIEDFMAQSKIDMDFTKIDGHNGLGILVPRRLLQKLPKLAEQIDKLKLPWNVEEHIQSIERHTINLHLLIDDYIIKAERSQERLDSLESEKNALFAEKNVLLGEKNALLGEKNALLKVQSEQHNLLVKKEMIFQQTCVQHEQELAEQQRRHEREPADFVQQHEQEFADYIIAQNHEIENLNQVIKNKEGHIELLLVSDRELMSLKSTRAYRLMCIVWRISGSLAPQESRRRLVLDMAVRFLRYPLRMLRKMTPRRIAAFFRIAKTEGVSGVSRRVDRSLLGTKIPPSQLELADVGVPKGIGDYNKLVFPVQTNPRVSIVIPVYNQFEYTYSCLQSILAHSVDVSYEIIIGDDRSDDLTTQLGQVAENIRIVTNPENLRFLKNCNAAASHAKGEFILFLNNDTQVQKDWLRPLVELMDRDETIGITGSKLVYADGTLQEAGGIFWDDASAWNYGNGSNPDLPEYNYVKDVDYISGAALLIRVRLWQEVGGFDEAFAPAYCEDADLAFAARKQGYRVVYQPASVVIHFEGVSNGTDTSSGQKSYQVVNTGKFLEKWGDTLKTQHFPNGHEVFLARDRSRDKKTLVMVDHHVPHFDKDAGSRTIYQYLELFAEQGYNIKFIGDNFYKHEPYTTALEQMGIEVLYGPYYQRNWKSWLAQNQTRIDYVFFNRPHITIKYVREFKKYPHIKSFYYGVDLHYLRELREYELTGDKSLLKSSQAIQRIELEILRSVDVSYYLSPVEITEIRKVDPDIRCKILPINILQPMQKILLSLQCQDLLFVGGFAHTPNISAVLWFAEKVLPIVLASLPTVRFHIVGSNPPEKVQALASEHIILHGYVTDGELRQLYRQCRMAVVPLLFGAGIKGKVVEAMHQQIPLVTTSIGAEGLPGLGECAFIQDTPEMFAHAITNHYDDIPALRRRVELAYGYVMECFSKEAAIRVLREDFDFTGWER